MEAVRPYMPFLEELGFGENQLKVFFKLPQILDAVAGHIQVLEQRQEKLIRALEHYTDATMKGKIAKEMGKPAADKTPVELPPVARPTAPGIPFSPRQPSSSPGAGKIPEWLQKLATPEVAIEIAKAIGGTGNTPAADSTTMAIAKVFEKGIRDEAIDKMRKIFKVSKEFKESVKAGEAED